MHALNSALALAARTPWAILAGKAQDHLADVVAETPDDQHLVFVFSWRSTRSSARRAVGNVSSTPLPS